MCLIYIGLRGRFTLGVGRPSTLSLSLESRRELRPTAKPDTSDLCPHSDVVGAWTAEKVNQMLFSIPLEMCFRDLVFSLKGLKRQLALVASRTSKWTFSVVLLK